MRLIRAHFAVSQPLFNCSILIPGIVARQGLLWRSSGILEDLVLALEDGDCLEGKLVRVLVAGLVWDALLVLDMLVSLIDIDMSCGQTLFKCYIIN